MADHRSSVKGIIKPEKIMEDELFKNWRAIQDKLKESYPHLTDADLVYNIGKEEELLSRLEQKLKKNKAEIRKWLSLMG